MRYIKVSFLIVLFLVVVALGVKTYTLTRIENFRITIVFGEDALVSRDPNQYSEGLMFFSGQAAGDELKLDLPVSGISMGKHRKTSYTPRETYQFLEKQFGKPVADKMKELYLQGINEDVSQ